jgi:adenylate cyclase class 2
MSVNNQEIETKFYVNDLKAVENKLIALGATCKLPRSFEYNLRFDDANGSLKRAHQVLRLRQSDSARLTFKGPGQQQNSAIVRPEIELVVNNFDTARSFLEALGYQAVVIYEKYRSMYELDHTQIALDELPYGNFVEIEVEKIETIANLAPRLGLKLEAAVPASYLRLFERLRTAKNLQVQNLAFIEFEGIETTAEDLDVTPAD